MKLPRKPQTWRVLLGAVRELLAPVPTLRGMIVWIRSSMLDRPYRRPRHLCQHQGGWMPLQIPAVCVITTVLSTPKHAKLRPHLRHTYRTYTPTLPARAIH